MAYENYPSTWKVKESKNITFSKKELPAAENKYAICRVSLSCLFVCFLNWVILFYSYYRIEAVSEFRRTLHYNEKF